MFSASEEASDSSWEVSTSSPIQREVVSAADSFLLHRVTGWLTVYGPPVIIALGTFGNVITIVIMRRMTSSSESTVQVYFTSMAVADLVVILSLTVSLYIKEAHIVLCLLSSWGFYAASVISAWILVCLTLHRAASVAWPHKVGLVLTQRRVIIVIAGVTVLLSLFTSHVFFTMQVLDVPVTDNSNDEQANESVSSDGTDGSLNFSQTEVLHPCTFKPEYQEFNYIYSYVYLAAYSIIPFLCLVVGNVFLIWKLIMSMKDATTTLTSGNAEQAVTRGKVTSSVTLTVVTVSTAYVVLTLPSCVYFITVYFPFTNNEFSGFEHAQVYFLDVVSFLLSSLNHAINFYLYCLPGRRFRQEFLNIFCCSSSRSSQGSTTVRSLVD